MFDDIFTALPADGPGDPPAPGATAGAPESPASPGALAAGGEQPAPESMAAPAAAGPPVADLTAPLTGWLAQSTRLAEASHLSEIAGSIGGLRRRLELPGFRLAVVGEFSVGKSLLVNQLLGAEVVPTGDVPVTAAPIVIRAAAKTEMHIRTPDGRLPSRELAEESWKDLVASAGAQAAGYQIRVDLDNSWLRQIDVELIDTPGYNETAMTAAEGVAAVLAHSDAALMVVSATQPLGMSEQEFLRDAVATKGVQQVAIVVTRLELLDDAGRIEVPEHIAEVAAGIAPEIQVLPGPGLPAAPACTEAIRAVIAGFARSRERAAWRSRQIAVQLAEELAGLVTVAEAGRAAADLDAAQRQAALEKAKADLTEQTKAWDRTSIELDRRRAALTGAVRARLDECSADLTERCLMTLSTAGDPKAYWERDLPYTVRRDLTTVARGMEDRIGATIAADVAWADSTMIKAFSERVAGPAGATERLEAPAGAAGPEVEVRDLNRTRILSRIAAPAAFVGASIVFPPLAAISALVPGFGMLFFAGGGLVAEEAFFKRRLAAEREALHHHVRGLVDDSIDAYVKAVDGRIKRLYGEVTEQLAKRRRNWYAARAAALSAPPAPGAGPVWASLAAAAGALHAQVVTALDQAAEATLPLPEAAPARGPLTLDAS